MSSTGQYLSASIVGVWRQGLGDRRRKGRTTGVGRRGEEVEEAKESGGRDGEEREGKRERKKRKDQVRERKTHTHLREYGEGE